MICTILIGVEWLWKLSIIFSCISDESLNKLKWSVHETFHQPLKKSQERLDCIAESSKDLDNSLSNTKDRFINIAKNIEEVNSTLNNIPTNLTCLL